jgi:hypothetical protein
LRFSAACCSSETPARHWTGIVMQHEIDGERAGGGREISIRTVEVG